MNKKLAIIVPYFGFLPVTFQAWLNSIKINPNVIYFLISDQPNLFFDCKNLVVVNMSFKDLQIKFKKMLNVNLKSPYKLCDLKPSYGYVFNDLIKEFDYWGYSDLDMVFGNLGTLLIQLEKNKYDKTFAKGHFSVYKNTSEINELFRIRKHNNKWDYIKNSKIIWVYDENYFGDVIGINGLFLSENKNLYNDVSLYSDIDPNKQGFFNFNNPVNNNFYYLTKLDLFEVSYDSLENSFSERKVFYAHFQKRNIGTSKISANLMLIYPFHWGTINSFESCKKALKFNHIQDDKFNKLRPKTNYQNKKLKLQYLLLEILNLDLTKILLSKTIKYILKPFFKKNNAYNK